jgi:UDP-N-acetylglucosamine 2-epimerase (non-hydrolysing)
MAPKKLLVVIGTRPEAIKLAPIVLLGRKRPEQFHIQVVLTAQHRQMLDQMLAEFGIEADLDLDIMKPDQRLCQVTTAAIDGLDQAISSLKPDAVIVQGDTTTTLAGALAAFYQRIPVAHVEAGLRTFDSSNPFPEEINRRLTTQLADFHFAPTTISRDNLIRDGVDPKRIWITGNTAIDALFLTLDKAGAVRGGGEASGRELLVTAHRRENHGAPMERICDAIKQLLDRFADLRIHFPVHMSPRVRAIVMPSFEDNPRVRLTEPLGYAEFVLAMNRAYLILTDSGGIQEEAPSLGKPVLVLRENTERPEAMHAGTALLVGTDAKRIVHEAARLLEEPTHYERMAKTANPYGDGAASQRILDALELELSGRNPNR